MGKLSLSDLRTIVWRSWSLEDKKALKVPLSPMALACWKHRKSAPRIPRMLPVCGAFRAMRCSWQDRGLHINVFCYRVQCFCADEKYAFCCHTMALPCSAIWAIKHLLLLLMFQHCQEAGVPAGWVVGVESQCVCSLPECLIVHWYGLCVSFQGVWAHTE